MIAVSNNYYPLLCAMSGVADITTSDLEERVNGFLSLLQKDDPDYSPGDPEEDRPFRIFLGQEDISDEEIGRTQSDILRDMIMKYKYHFHEDEDEDECTPQIILRSQGEDAYRIWLEIYPSGELEILQEEIITRDICIEYIKAFHERFYDC